LVCADTHCSFYNGTILRTAYNLAVSQESQICPLRTELHFKKAVIIFPGANVREILPGPVNMVSHVEIISAIEPPPAIAPVAVADVFANINATILTAHLFHARSHHHVTADQIERDIG